MKGYDICEKCGQKLDTTKLPYFEMIANLKKEYETKYGENPTHIIVGVDDYYNLEMSDDLLDRLKRIMDTTKGIVRTHLMGMKVIKSEDFKGISVCKL